MNHNKELSSEVKNQTQLSELVDEFAQKNKDSEVEINEFQKKPFTTLNVFTILGLLALFVGGFAFDPIMYIFIIVLCVTVALFINKKNPKSHVALQVIKVILMIIAVIALVGLGACALLFFSISGTNFN